MITVRRPVLMEDASRLEWIKARYEPHVEIKGDHAHIVHKLYDAEELDELIRSGSAEWVTELRCPRTLLSRQECSGKSEQIINLTAEDILGETFLIPGLVATQEIELLSSGNLNDFVWPYGSKVIMPAGWWLIRGEPRTTDPLTASLVRFVRDSKGKLEPGQMSVSEESDGGNPYFRVTLAKDLYDERRGCRDVQISGLIGACGMLPSSSMNESGDNADHPISLRLHAAFEEANIENIDWNSSTYDPARAATVLENFYVLSEDEEG